MMEGDQLGHKVTTTTTKRLCKGVRLWGTALTRQLLQWLTQRPDTGGQWLTRAVGTAESGLENSPQIGRPMQDHVGKWGE